MKKTMLSLSESGILEGLVAVEPGKPGWCFSVYEEKESIEALQDKCEILERANERLQNEVRLLKEENNDLVDIVDRLNRKVSELLSPEKLSVEAHEARQKAKQGKSRYLMRLRRECIQNRIPLIRYYRIMKDITQKELADKIGLEQPHVSRWESGEVVPNHENLQRLADTLEISVDQLLGRKD